MNLNIKHFYNKYVAEGGKLSYFAFRDLIIAYNKAMISECIQTGNVWKLHGVGILKVVQFKRKIKVLDDGTLKGAIDWKASNDLKNRLLVEGKTLLEVYKDENGNKIGDNGGHPWLCYHTSTFCYRWAFSPHLYMKNGTKFKFTPSWGNSRLLSKSINDDSTLLYKSLDSK